MPEWVVRSLLEHGANIGMKNHFEELPIDFIVPEMLEKFFSEYCIKYDEATDVNHEKFEITFDYSFLAPPIGSFRVLIHLKFHRGKNGSIF